MHSAKGLEWPVVHLPQLVDGFVPSDMALSTPAGEAEEQRLFYVAVTRARDQLYLYAPLRLHHHRMARDDRHGYAQLSRFLGAPALACCEVEEAAPPRPLIPHLAPLAQTIGRELDALWGRRHAGRDLSSADLVLWRFMSNPTLQIIIASTRPGRVGPSVAAWIDERAVAHGGFEVELVDLAEVNLPLFDEPKHPRFGEYVHQHTKDWSAIVARGDAFIFVVPEYNHGFNAAIKNALDYLNREWRDKAVGFVSYGGVAAGTRAVQMLKPVLAALKMVPLFDAVNIPFVQQFLDADRNLQPNEIMESAATVLLDELVAWSSRPALDPPARRRHRARPGRPAARPDRGIPAQR